MNRIRWAGWLLVITLLAGAFPFDHAEAARGAPGSPEFGYGASLNPNGPYLEQSFFLAGSLQLDWLALDVSWRAIEPDAGAQGNWESIEPAMQQAAQQKTAVLIRLVDPPAWALTAQGPVAEEVNRFLGELIERYAGTVQAVELFPAANTPGGWGAPPDPFAYAALFSDAHKTAASQEVLLVAAGLRPVNPGDAGVDDLQFLQGLYAAGLGPIMPVISLDLANLSGDPLTPPCAGRPASLRHYEQVRDVMLQNDHDSGLIWITRLGLASGTIDSAASQPLSLEQHKEWLHQAAMQIRSQLYIGVTVFQSLNPAPTEASSAGNHSLILENAEIHPFYPLFKAFIDQNTPNEQDGKPGRPKDYALIKAKN